MKKTNTFTKYALLMATSTVIATSSAMAANSFYAPGDLVLFFQQQGGTNTVYVDLGAATTFRGAAAGADATSQYDFVNVNTTLVSAFGTGWASDATIFAGIAGVFNTSNTQNTLNNGDPSRTLYVSKARDLTGVIGSANTAAWSGFGSTAMTDAAGKISTQNNTFLDNSGALGYNAAQIVSPTSESTIDNQNPLSVVSGQIIQGTAFNNFGGGVSQQGTTGNLGAFGSAGTAEFNLDLYRILARATGGTGTGNTFVTGQVDGPLRAGSYEGTFTVNGTGGVSFTSTISAVPEPSGALALGLIGTFAGLGYRRRRSA